MVEVDGILVAPTEPAALKRLGESSSVPEGYGVDVLWGSEVLGLCGVQRKEVKDLVASMEDGRLGKEVAQMNGKLGLKMVVVEGKGLWSSDGRLMNAWATRVSREQVRGFLWTVRSEGVWVDYSDNLEDTILLIRGLIRWSRKGKHTALLSRPGPPRTADWGKVGRRDWAIHLLCGFEGVGKGVAEKILDHFGEVPLRWEVTEKELMEVEGIGKVRARKLVEALEREKEGAR